VIPEETFRIFNMIRNSFSSAPGEQPLCSEEHIKDGEL